MTWSPPTEPVDEEALQEALAAVVGTAHRNDVTVADDWPCRDGMGPDWDIEVVRLDSRGGEE